MSKDKTKAAEADIKDAEISKKDKEIEELKAKLEAAENAEAIAKAPEGVKLTIAVKDYKGEGKFPPEGSDGKGNLIKYVSDKKLIEKLKSEGWK